MVIRGISSTPCLRHQNGSSPNSVRRVILRISPVEQKAITFSLISLSCQLALAFIEPHIVISSLSCLRTSLLNSSTAPSLGVLRSMFIGISGNSAKSSSSKGILFLTVLSTPPPPKVSNSSMKCGRSLQLILQMSSLRPQVLRRFKSWCTTNCPSLVMQMSSSKAWEWGAFSRNTSRVFYGPSKPPPLCPMQKSISESTSQLRRLLAYFFLEWRMLGKQRKKREMSQQAGRISQSSHSYSISETNQDQYMLHPNQSDQTQLTCIKTITMPPKIFKYQRPHLVVADRPKANLEEARLLNRLNNQPQEAAGPDLPQKPRQMASPVREERPEPVKQQMTSSKKNPGDIKFDPKTLELTLPRGVKKINTISKLQSKLVGCLERKEPYLPQAKMVELAKPKLEINNRSLKEDLNLHERLSEKAQSMKALRQQPEGAMESHIFLAEPIQNQQSFDALRLQPFEREEYDEEYEEDSLNFVEKPSLFFNEQEENDNSYPFNESVFGRRAVHQEKPIVIPPYISKRDSHSPRQRAPQTHFQIPNNDARAYSQAIVVPQSFPHQSMQPSFDINHFEKQYRSDENSYQSSRKKPKRAYRESSVAPKPFSEAESKQAGFHQRELPVVHEDIYERSSPSRSGHYGNEPSSYWGEQTSFFESDSDPFRRRKLY